MGKLTGFSPIVRKVIQDRSGGLCEQCGEKPVEQVHHRRPRGAGGSRRPDTNQAANGFAICAECHIYIESYRTYSYSVGWLLRQPQTPGLVPVLRCGEWVLLSDSGDYQTIPEPATGSVA